MKTILISLLLFCLSASAADPADFQLGKLLLKEGSSELAAIEFRRYAMEAESTEQKGMAYLHATYAYIRAEKLDEAQHMLQKAEELLPADPAVSILNAEIAAGRGDPQTALYFLDLPGTYDPSVEDFRTRRSAEMYLRAGDPQRALRMVEGLSSSADEEVSALGRYIQTPHKSPAIGGWLGLIPGAGYWYSGEISNGFRSLILNGLFMYGMAQTAQDEQWGAFAVISFFEITWYSGSIYGGIDAAHRYNRNLLENCVNCLNVPDLEPDPEVVIPVFQLKVLF